MHDASDLARRLARNAEAVCRHYLPNGRRQGRYWLVGNVEGTPGRSLFVRLTGPDAGKGAAGKWTDAATGEHGDLLDLIAANKRLGSLTDTLEEARHFLSLPAPEPQHSLRKPPAPTGSPEAARRLWRMSQPIHDTFAETYLRSRGITYLHDCGCLRFHPNCWYRADKDEPPGTPEAFPALIAAVRDGDGKLTGVHRTWLAPELNPTGSRQGPGSDAATRDGRPARARRPVRPGRRHHDRRRRHRNDALASPDHARYADGRSSIGRAPGGTPAPADPAAPLYRARQRRRRLPSGRATHADRAHEAGIEPVPLDAKLGDFNDDLRHLGTDAMRADVRVQLVPEDAERLFA